MVGRGSIGRPWIFREIKHLLTTGNRLPAEDYSWYADVLKQLIAQNVERLGERRGILHSRRHLAATPLFKNIPDAKQTRIAMLRAETLTEVFRFIDLLQK